MYESTHQLPGRMTPEQRRHEVAFLLAVALSRLRCAVISPPINSAAESEVLLGFSGEQSVHGNPSTRE